MSFAKYFAALALLLSGFSVLHGQAAGPTTGEITVQLVQGIDSSVNPQGKSEGRVTKSTNPAVPVGSTALLGLKSDPINGGYTLQLMRLGIRGTVVPAASSAVALAPDLFNKMLEKTRAAGQPQDAVTGTRVFLPEKMIVRLTLAEPTPPPVPSPSAQPRVAVRRAILPPPPVPVTGKAGDFPAGPDLPVLHTDRTPFEGCHWSPVVSQRYGFAILGMDCAGKGADSPPHKYSADDPAFIDSYEDARKRQTADPNNTNYHGTSITVFTKPPAQTLDAAVRSQVLSTVKARWRPYCHVQKAPDQTAAAGLEFYTFTGTSGPALQVYKKADFSDTLPCAPWEDNDSANDFVYKPSDSKTTFFFVALGQDDPDFDVASIKFLQ